MAPGAQFPTPAEQMMAQIVLGVAIDRFRMETGETMTRAAALAILDEVRTDPAFFESETIAAHERIEKAAREMICGQVAITVHGSSPPFSADQCAEVNALFNELGASINKRLDLVNLHGAVVPRHEVENGAA